MTKLCPKCRKPVKKGRVKRNKKYCSIKCGRLTSWRRWYSKNTKICSTKRKLARIIEYKSHPLRDVIRTAKARAKLLKLPWNLVYEDLLPLPTVCPVLGILLNYNNRARDNFDKPTLDRRIPNLGYIKGNVFVVSWRANKLKSDATPEELQKLASYTTR
jgi:endogenous inhibitor of DNA gyrase (YacG/DUF329 family)